LNKTQRKKLEDIVENIYVIKGDIEELKESEEESFSNLPENLQEDDRGLQLETNVESLESAVGLLDELENLLQELIGE